jgi:outer membrane protein
VIKNFALTLALTLFAGAAAAEVNVAVVNIQRAIGESDEAKALLQQLESELAPEQTTLKSLGTEITSLQEKFNKDSEVMSDAEKRRRQKEIEDKQIDYQFRVNKLQKTVQDRQQEILGQMEPKVNAVLKDLIDQQKYDVILARQGVIYADNRLDITAKVTELLNLKK